MNRLRVLAVVLTFVPCGLFLLGLVIGVIATDDPVEIG